MALKIRILPYLHFNTKSNPIPRNFLWPFSYTFSLVYSPLNSASCSIEVTLNLSEVQIQIQISKQISRGCAIFQKKVGFTHVRYKNFLSTWTKGGIKISMLVHLRGEGVKIGPPYTSDSIQTSC